MTSKALGVVGDSRTKRPCTTCGVKVRHTEIRWYFRPTGLHPLESGTTWMPDGHTCALPSAEVAR